MSSPLLFQDQGLLVINGTEGIAPAVINLAAQRGATILFSVKPGCQAAADQILATAQVSSALNRVTYLVTELLQEEEIESLFDTALERLTGLNVLIQNLEAPGVQDTRPLHETCLEEWNRVLSTQLRSPFMVARRALEEFLVAQVNGRIVYISYSGNDAVTTSPGYSAAQAGLHALVRCITKEFGRRELACNAVIVHEDGLEAISTLEPAIAPSERIHSVLEVSSELAETVLFLASREASFVNGEVLDIKRECLQKC